jgi:hypothetical protein
MNQRPLHQRPASPIAVAALFLVAGCSGGDSGGGAASQLDLIEISNGFGLMLPHLTFRADAGGAPTSELLAIRTLDDLYNNVTPQNPILPVTEWPTTLTLPNGDAGNHYIYAEFTQPLAINSVLDPSPAGQANSGLIGPITVLAIDPSNGQSVPVVGRAFVGGKTYAGNAGSGATLPLQQWVDLDSTGKPVPTAVDNDVSGSNGFGVPDGLGFPGTESAAAFPGSSKLVSDRVFVFVVDSDGDLSTHEAFPTNRQIRLRATTALAARNGRPLMRQLVASATVGVDLITPEIVTTPPPNAIPDSIPAFGDTDVDPQTTITLKFTEPLQPASLGSFANVITPTVSSAVTVKFGPPAQQTQVPFTITPRSAYDLSEWELTPVFAFPGNGPASQDCGTFNTVNVDVIALQVVDLATNQNTRTANTMFVTGEGPGLVNAPVAPDVIYVARTGATPGISVVDLNGFGQSTGDPRFDFSYLSFPKGWSNFPNNPNLIQYGPTAFPQLVPGSCTVDGGSAGVFTLTRDSSLNDLLVRPPILTSVGEMSLGQSLDLVFHNGRDATGCRFGGGNFCAVNGKKVILTAFQTGQTLGPPLPQQQIASQVPGGANPVSFSPHPNPPPLVFPPLCLQPFIGGQEPTSIYTVTPIPNGGLGLGNLLVPGISKRTQNVPPTGILARFQNSFFEGPDRPSLPSTGPCFQYQYRQQIGHFMYMLDRARREVVVFNSNRMTVLDRIPVDDPTDLTMGPQLDFIAISNQNADSVTFIDINPQSANFHQVVKVTPVARGPRGIAWDPGNEDIIVCCEEDRALSVISAFTFNVRKTVQSNLNSPFDVVISQRQVNFGFNRQVYYGWVLNRNGDLTLFESGPSGVNGWGYDNTIGVAPFKFVNPKTISLNWDYLGGSVWVVHENPLGPTGAPTGVIGGAVTRVDVDAASFGPLPLTGFQFFVNPNFRDLSLVVRTSIGPSQLTGVPIDIAFDELNNIGSVSNLFSVYSVGSPILINGKSYVKPNGGTPVQAVYPDYMFVAVPNSSEGPGVIDVIQLTSGNTRFDTDGYLPGTQSIPCPGARYLSTYFRL